MSDYIRRQDVVKECGEWYVEEGPEEGFIGTVSQMLDMFSPADVVQVVRCRKCKYFWTYQCMDSMPIETCELAQTFYNPDLDFCSLAKRREE